VRAWVAIRAGAANSRNRSAFGSAGATDADLVKELAFLMFSLAKKGKRTQAALFYSPRLVRDHRRLADT
jgi:hypothetical protein